MRHFLHYFPNHSREEECYIRLPATGKRRKSTS